jgi:hypothetical protein
VAAAAALRLAEVLDTAESGSGAANASRELRQHLEALRLTEEDPLPGAEELAAGRSRRESDREWAELTAELSAAGGATPTTGEEGEDREPPTPFAY